MENKISNTTEPQHDAKLPVMRFYFKVNNSKLQDEIRLKNQIEKVIKRLVERNNIRSESVELFFESMMILYLIGVVCVFLLIAHN